MKTIGLLLSALLLSFMTLNVYAQNQFNDAEVAAIAVAANKIDINYGKLAKKKSTNKNIIEFANTMISDHSAVIDQAVDLVTKLGVTPQESSLSRQLNSDAEATLKKLKASKGSAFDKAYIDNEVAYHRAVINAVKNVLIPDTDNKELKGLLTAILPALEAHLEHAEKVQKDMINLSDAEIASIAVAANKIDINYGKLAKEKSNNKEVVEFANTMIRDHSGVIDQAVALVTKLGVTPKDNAMSRQLNSGAEAMLKTLKSKNGKAFDKAYVDNEVAYHKAVINAVRTVLIPGSSNEELKGLLTAILPALDSHLEHAELLQKNLSK
jgi:putative membrane protein